MRIGVNALYMIPGAVGGTEIYLRNLLAALAMIDRSNDYYIFTNLETGPDLVPSAPNFRVEAQRVRGAIRPARILWEQTVLPLRAVRLGVDVLFNPGFTSPVLFPEPQVTVFHDLQHKRHPEHFRWFDLPFWRVLLYLSAHCSRRIIAVSETTRADILRYYRIPPSRVIQVQHGVEKAFFGLTRQESAEPFILTVSTLHPHKNLDGLLRAFARFSESRPDYRLVIAGLRGFFTGALERLRDSLKLRDRVTFTGWIARDQLLALFSTAAAFVYPSRFEGFGMPVLEALAAGLPTACSDVEPMKSIAGNAALLFNPADEHAVCSAMERLTSDAKLRRELAHAGPARAARFTWEKTASETLTIFTETTGPRCASA